MPWETLARSPASIAVIDAAGTIVQATAQFCELFGYDPAEIVGQTVEGLVPYELRAQHRVFRAEFLAMPIGRRARQRRDLVGQTKQGRTIPVEITLTPIEHEGVPLTLAWVVDRSEHTAQDQRFRLAIEGAPSGIVFVDHTGRIAHCNKQVCDDFGYSRAELVGRQVEMLTPAAVESNHSRLREGYLENPTQRPMGRGRELYGRRKDGSEFPVEIGLTPIPHPDHTWTMASIVDITERKKTEMELVARNEDLLDFVYSASHDLKAPLSTIRGLVSIAKDDLEEGNLGSVAELLEVVEEKARKLSDLVVGTLALARTGRVEALSGSIALAELMNEIVAQSEIEAVHSRTHVSVEADPALRLHASQESLRVILDNLLGNSIKYHNPDRDERYVILRVEERPDAVIIEVEDNGLGIPHAQHSKVFEMFQRFHPDSADGNGLGLAMVRKQVAAMGGSIDFTSGPEGTTFHIQLPKNQAQ